MELKSPVSAPHDTFIYLVPGTTIKQASICIMYRTVAIAMRRYRWIPIVRAFCDFLPKSLALTFSEFQSIIFIANFWLWHLEMIGRGQIACRNTACGGKQIVPALFQSQAGAIVAWARASLCPFHSQVSLVTSFKPPLAPLTVLTT